MLHLLRHGLDVTWPRDVGFNRECPPLQLFHFARRFVDLNQSSRDRDNVGALARETDRDGFADAATGAGYEDHFSVKLHRHQREKNRWALSFRILAFVVALKSLRSWNFCKEFGWLSECGISEPSMIRSSSINLSGSRRSSSSSQIT